MALIDALVQAETAEERLKALDAWEQPFGSYDELARRKRLSAILSEAVPPERYADLLRAYARSRRRYLESVSKGADRATVWLQSREFDYHMTLYLLAQHLEGDLEPARRVIEDLLLSGDGEMMGVASVLFERMGPQAWGSLPAIRQATARHGVFEEPFHLGAALAACIRVDPARLRELESALRDEGDRGRQALFCVVHELGEMAARLLPSVLEIVRSASIDPETLSYGLIALGGLGVACPEVAAVVRAAIDSPHWFIRGNAIYAAGQLRLDPDTFVPLIVAHLEDDEGDDWSAAEMAEEALERYGPAAASIRQKLQRSPGEVDPTRTDKKKR